MLQEMIHFFRRLCHAVGQYISGICVIPQQPGFFQPESRNFPDNLRIVAGIGMVAAGSIGFEEFFPEFSVIGIFHKRNVTGGM